MIEEMEYQLKNLLKNNQPQDYIEIIEKENEEYIEIINNLQSKIDKAIKYIENFDEPLEFFDTAELLNILKEENNG